MRQLYDERKKQQGRKPIGEKGGDSLHYKEIKIEYTALTIFINHDINEWRTYFQRSVSEILLKSELFLDIMTTLAFQDHNRSTERFCLRKNQVVRTRFMNILGKKKLLSGK